MNQTPLFHFSRIGILFLIGVAFLYPLLPVLSVEASGQPADYIVFEKQAVGVFTPVYYLPVELVAPLVSWTDAQILASLAQPERDVERIVVALQAADGSTAYQSVVELSRWIRAEFHGLNVGDPIDGRTFPNDHPAFVVRLPRLDATTLVIKDSHEAIIARFDLTVLSAQTPRIKLEPKQELPNQAFSASPANRVDFLIMGDGYTAAEAAKFADDANTLANNFFAISPYSVYQNYFNISTLFTASSQSGADHPPYNASCSSSDLTCCGDPEMQNDPLQGQMVNTAFDARFCANLIHRLLVVDVNKVLAAAAAVPDWDSILVIVNDATYGGSGGSVAVISMHSTATQIAQHEYAHSFVGLADEYEYAYPGYPACSDQNGPACESNVTDLTTRAQIKWNPWILTTTTIPTPEAIEYDGLVGLFEGARYQETGMYRPGLDCIMRSLGAPFCQVPSQSFVLRLYQGGWGIPQDGISLVEPGSASPGTPLMLTHPATQTFHVDILSPVGGPASQITWLDNGIPISGATSDTLAYTTSTSGLGAHQIKISVKDPSSLVHPAMAGNALVDEYTWDVSIKALSTTTVSSDNPDPSIVGQAITVAFSVTSTGGTPTGNVTVSDGSVSCTATVAAGSCQLTPTTAGAKTLTATYAGDANFIGSSGTASHTVNKANTTTTVSSDNPDPSIVGQAITVAFSVTSTGGTPTGNVTVSDGSVSCTATVAAGSCQLTPTTAGAKTLTATYAGDANFIGSSGTASHTVNKANTTTTVSSDNPDPSIVGQAITVAFSVTSTGGTPTGNVTVSDGSVSCTATVAAGSCQLTPTTAGAKTLTATYAGDANFIGSSGTASHTVNKANTTTTVSSDNPDPSIVGQAITVAFSVTSTGGTPTGNVTVSDGSVSCTATVAAGSCQLTPTTAGAKTLTATYAGDANFIGSSGTASHTVNKANTTTTVSSDNPDPSIVGQAITVAFSVTSTGGTPTGNVTVSDGSISCTATVAAGSCQLTPTTAGAKTLTATYAGDANFIGSSGTASHTVNKANTTTTVSSDNPDPSIVGQAITVAFSVTSTGGTPTGNVTVSDGSVSCSATVAAGSCQLTLTTAGAKTLTATYAGDANFSGSSGTAVHMVDSVLYLPFVLQF